MMKNLLSINNILSVYNRFSCVMQCAAHISLPFLARLVFASTLSLFFWRSAKTKLGEGFSGLFIPDAGAYAQIIPLRFEAVGYDTSALGFFDWLLAFAGTWGEFILPLLIVFGLFTRLASLGMIGFIAVMSIVDIFGHGVNPGMIFDGNPSGLIYDQRLYWILCLWVLISRGAGKLSLDYVLSKMVKNTSSNSPSD